jgi:hypothetical protein
MSKKVDKFIIFGKKFAKLDNEGQDKLVKTARELLKAHKGVKTASISRNAQVEPNANNETGKIC